jgi:hypothetical protein
LLAMRPHMRIKAYLDEPVSALDTLAPGTHCSGKRVVASEMVMRMREVWMLALVAIPMVLIVLGAVALALAVPFLSPARRRPALQAMECLTTLARVLRSRAP